MMSEKIFFSSNSSIILMTTQNRSRMARNQTKHSVWTQTEQEQLIQWLEDPENLRKTNKGSGVSKKAIISEIAAQIPTKPPVKVSYKYDNLMKSY